LSLSGVEGKHAVNFKKENQRESAFSHAARAWQGASTLNSGVCRAGSLGRQVIYVAAKNAQIDIGLGLEVENRF
jgi:hypothetical protein